MFQNVTPNLLIIKLICLDLENNETLFQPQLINQQEFIYKLFLVE